MYMTTVKVIPTAVLVLFFLTFPVKAEFIHNEENKYYAVNEPDPHKLIPAVRRTIKKVCEGSGHVFACTSTNMQLKSNAVKVDKRKCGLSVDSLTLRSIYRLPQWTHADKAPDDIRQKWERIMQSREIHEKHHGAIWDKHLRVAYNELQNLETRCNHIKIRAQRILDKAEKNALKESRKFDKRDGNYRTTFPN